MKDQNAKWMPVGARFQRLLQDIIRVWPGPGENGLQLQQVGVTVPLDSVREPCVRVSNKRKRDMGYVHLFVALTLCSCHSIRTVKTLTSVCLRV